MLSPQLELWIFQNNMHDATSNDDFKKEQPYFCKPDDDIMWIILVPVTMFVWTLLLDNRGLQLNIFLVSNIWAVSSVLAKKYFSGQTIYIRQGRRRRLEIVTIYQHSSSWA